MRAGADAFFSQKQFRILVRVSWSGLRAQNLERCFVFGDAEGRGSGRPSCVRERPGSVVRGATRRRTGQLRVPPQLGVCGAEMRRARSPFRQMHARAHGAPAGSLVVSR